MERPYIDYHLLNDALQFYHRMGYRQVEVPWMVGREACFATLDEGQSNAILTDDQRYLVGSAEQGFLEMDLPHGSYMAVSPCFRRGERDSIHQETFVKLELHRTDVVTLDALHTMIEQCRAYFRSLAPDLEIELVATSHGWDIEMEGVEIGSYGRRSALGRTWLYGTGLALPRFTQVRGG